MAQREETSTHVGTTDACETEAAGLDGAGRADRARGGISDSDSSNKT